jgi:hypothetical protein
MCPYSADGRAAAPVRQHPARPLRLLWAAAQLARAERFPPKPPAYLIPLPSATSQKARRLGGVDSKPCSNASLCRCRGHPAGIGKQRAAIAADHPLGREIVGAGNRALAGKPHRGDIEQRAAGRGDREGRRLAGAAAGVSATTTERSVIRSIGCADSPNRFPSRASPIARMQEPA